LFLNLDSNISIVRLHKRYKINDYLGLRSRTPGTLGQCTGDAWKATAAWPKTYASGEPGWARPLHEPNFTNSGICCRDPNI